MLGVGDPSPWWITVAFGGMSVLVGVVWLLSVKFRPDLLHSEWATKAGGWIFVVLGLMLAMGGIASR